MLVPCGISFTHTVSFSCRNPVNYTARKSIGRAWCRGDNRHRSKSKQFQFQRDIFHRIEEERYRGNSLTKGAQPTAQIGLIFFNVFCKRQTNFEFSNLTYFFLFSFFFYLNTICMIVENFEQSREWSFDRNLEGSADTRIIFTYMYYLEKEKM